MNLIQQSIQISIRFCHLDDWNEERSPRSIKSINVLSRKIRRFWDPSSLRSVGMTSTRYFRVHIRLTLSYCSILSFSFVCRLLRTLVMLERSEASRTHNLSVLREGDPSFHSGWQVRGWLFADVLSRQYGVTDVSSQKRQVLFLYYSPQHKPYVPAYCRQHTIVAAHDLEALNERLAVTFQR